MDSDIWNLADGLNRLARDEATVDQIMSLVDERLQQMLSYGRIGLATVDEAASTATAVWARSRHPLSLKTGFSALLQDSSLRLILERRSARILNDLLGYLRRRGKSESTELIIQEGYRSSLTLPLVYYDRPVGFLFLSHEESGAFRQEQAELLTRASDPFALHILLAVQRQRRRETYSRCLRVLADVLGTVAPSTFSSLSRTAKLAREMARALHHPKEMEIESAVVLSQMGKAAIPSAILQKMATDPDALSNEEREIVTQAKRFGQHIISRIPELGNMTGTFPSHDPPGVHRSQSRVTGAVIVDLVCKFDELRTRGIDEREALVQLSQHESISRPIRTALQQIRFPADAPVCEVLNVEQLRPGLFVDSSVETVGGTLLVARSQMLSETLIQRIRNFHRAEGVREPIRVRSVNWSR